MSMRSVEPQGYGVQGRDDYGTEQDAESISVIDRFSNFDGTFHSTRDLRIEGQVKGTIDCQGTLFVAQGANVTAKVEAENITVAGDLNGDIRCRGRLQIMPSGRLRGKVTTETLVINEGAFYEGQLEMSSMALESRPVNGPRPLPPVSSPPTNGEPRGARGEPSTGSSAANANSTTFIRRFGGPETPWEAPAEEETEGSTKRES